MNKGTSQISRINKALDPGYFSIDERSLLELVQYTIDFAQNVNFYDDHKNIIGNWGSFLLKDSAFILAMIAATDLNQFKLNYEEIKYYPDENLKAEKFKTTTNSIYQLALNWHGQLEKTEYRGSVMKELDKLKQLIDSKEKIDQGEKLIILKENYENILGNLLYIKEKAGKNFNEEILKYGHQPHIGLLLAFFELYKYLQTDINTITKKHLDYYFQNILQQKKKHTDAHSAIIAIKLQPNRDLLTIEEGDKFNLTFEDNQQLEFSAAAISEINKAEIAEIKTLFKSSINPFGHSTEENAYLINILYEADIFPIEKNVPNSEVKEFGEFPATLGEEISHHLQAESSIKLSEVGIIVSSPTLILENGYKHIKLSFIIERQSFEKMSADMHAGRINHDLSVYKEVIPVADEFSLKDLTRFVSDALIVSVTGDEGWQLVEHCKTKIDHENRALNIDLYLDEDQNLMPYTTEIHGGEYQTSWPCIRLIMNNDAQFHPYSILKDIVIDEINIKTTVDDATNLLLSNSTGNLDNSTPFTPFGPTPLVGSFLRIQNPLIFHKNLSELTLNITWLGLPQTKGGFPAYYSAYPVPPKNEDFKAVVTQNKNNIRAKDPRKIQQVQLFDSDDEYINSEKELKINTVKLSFRDEAKSFTQENNGSPLYLVLSEPENAFGHPVFSDIYASSALKKSRLRKTAINLPNQPYTPVIERLSVSYSNWAREVMMRKQEEKDCEIRLIHIHPFGHNQVFPGPVKAQSFLFPQVNQKGNLFVGLTNVISGNIVSIGFELIPAVYIHTVVNVPVVKWQYLINNEWEPLNDLLLEDSTEGLKKTGIVKIRIPKTVQLNNTRFPKGKFWIRACYNEIENLTSRIKNVFTQAVLLTSENSNENSTSSLAGKKVTKINLTGKEGINSIKGPYELKINELIESEESFYNRVSENLRHKNRAVSNWDIERIILEKFKNIDKVRVYGKNSHPREIVKGSNIQIVVIPKNNMVNGSRSNRSKVGYSTLMEVKNYISKLVSPYAKIEVSNPVYEQLKVRCKVKFKDMQKSGYYKNVLNTELISYLSPDIESEFVEKGFEESFSKSEILNFIEKRKYVDFVTEFSVLQIVEVQGKYKIIDTAIIKKINELRTISAYAILTSAPEHQIESVNDEDLSDPKKSGIGDLSIENDFIISDSGKYL